MELIYSLFIGLLLVSALAYLMVMLVLSIGWYSLSNFQYKHQSQAPLFVSIVVAVRNENENILALLNSLEAQSYPEDHFEIRRQYQTTNRSVFARLNP